MRMKNESKAVKHTHAAKGTAEEIEGDAPFDAGATIRIWSAIGVDPFFVGSSKAAAESNRLGGVLELGIKIIESKTTFWFDGATGGVYYMNQVFNKESGI